MENDYRLSAEDDHKKAQMRRLAEEVAEKNRGDIPGLSDEDTQQLVHELRVHQIQLEMQNEELRRIQEALAISRDQYAVLHNLAPMGYVTVGDEELIQAANLAAASMLKVHRKMLIGKPLSHFVARADQDTFYLYSRKIIRTRSQRSCEIQMVREDGSLFDAGLECVAIKGTDESGTQLLIVMTDITWRKEAERQRMSYQKQLQSLAAQLALVEQQQRRKIATDLHDRIGQTLAAALLKLGQVKALAPSSEFANALEDVRALIDQMYRDARSLNFELGPPALYEQGLFVALQQLSREVDQRYNLQVEVYDDGQSKPLDVEFRDFLFRAVRELLINVAKHAQSTWAKVYLSRAGDNIRIVVEDKGAGFDVSILMSGTESGFGLFSIRERLKFLGGAFDLQSRQGKGTRVAVELPLDLAEDTGGNTS